MHGVTPRYGAKDAAAIVGRVFRAGKGWGALTGQAVIVVGAEVGYTSDADNEDAGDMRGGGWWAERWVRAATPGEAAPLLAQEAKQAVTTGRIARIAAVVGRVMAEGRVPEAEADGMQLGPDAWVVEPRTGTVGRVLAVEGERVVVWDSGRYDDYRRSAGVLTDPALAGEVRGLLEASEYRRM